MRQHLERALMILGAIAGGAFVLALVAAAMLPGWLARYFTAPLSLGFMLALCGAGIVGLICGGMFLQRWEDDARMSKLLRDALVPR